jgi:hypothetical protein
MTNRILCATLFTLLLAAPIYAQESESGFTITMKNGSVLKGRTLTRDASSGALSLTLTESAAGNARSYAVVAVDDAEAIKAGSSETESIRIKLTGGSEIKCREFGLNGNTITVKIGTASKIEIGWDQIESISFAG